MTDDTTQDFANRLRELADQIEAEKCNDLDWDWQYMIVDVTEDGARARRVSHTGQRQLTVRWIDVDAPRFVKVTR